MRSTLEDLEENPLLDFRWQLREGENALIAVVGVHDGRGRLMCRISEGVGVDAELDGGLRIRMCSRSWLCVCMRDY